MKGIRLWIRLSPSLVKDLDELVQKQGFSSRQDVIRVLIRDAVLKQRGIVVG